MAKRNKKDDLVDEEKSIEAFVIPQRASAFIEAYQPCAEKMATETFDETRLRNFFKAYPLSLGDPLAIYLDMLAVAGFRLKISSSGDLAIFVTEKIVNSKSLTL